MSQATRDSSSRRGDTHTNATGRAQPRVEDATEARSPLPNTPDAAALDYQALFESAPGAYLVLAIDAPHFTILAANSAYLCLAGRTRQALIGQGVFEAFPDNPDDPSAHGVASLRASLDAVLRTRTADSMAVVRYDVRRSPDEGDAFEERYWNTLNTPIFAADGAMTAILQRVDEVTEFIRSSQQLAEEQHAESECVETTIIARVHEVVEANRHLRALHQEAQAARAAAETASRRLQAVLDVLPVGVGIADSQGKGLVLNPAFYDLWGLTASQLADGAAVPIFRGWWPTSGNPVEDEQWAMARALRMGAVVRDEEVEIETFNGERKTILNHAAPIRDAEGAIVGAVVAEMDITVRTQLQRAVVAQANQLATIFETLADAVFVYDANGSLTWMNATALRLVGAPSEEVYRARPLDERIAPLLPRDEHGEPLPKSQWPITRTLQGEVLTGSATMELGIRTLDGRIIDLNVSSAPVRDASGAITGAVSVFRDVTERRRLELRTRAALDALVRLAGELARADLADDAHAIAARLVALAREVLGADIVSLVGMSLSAEDGADRFVPLATIGRTPADEARWYETVGDRGSLEYYTPEQFERLRLGEVSVLDVSRVAARGVPTDDTISTAIAPLVTSHGHLEGVLAVAYVRGPVAHVFDDNELALAAGFARVAHLLLQRERLLAERETARAHELALAEANRRMDDFLHTATHELKAPITTLHATLQLGVRRIERLRQHARPNAHATPPAELTQHPDPTEETLRFVADGFQRNQHQVRRLMRLIDDLVDAARIQSGKLEIRLEACDLVQLVHEVVAEQRVVQPTRMINLQVAEGLTLPVHADADRIGQVVTNFLNNAIKYSAADWPVVVTLAAHGDLARLTVRDEGRGIPLEEQARVWERGHRVASGEASGEGVGLGLGLHISSGIIERHNGQIGLESAVGKGSTFWFTLPLANA